MIDIIEGVTRKLQRNAQWKGTMNLADVKEGLVVMPATGNADEFTVAEGGDTTGTKKNLYITLTNGSRGDVEIAGLSVIGGPEGFSFRLYNDCAYATDPGAGDSLFDVSGAPRVHAEDPIFVDATNFFRKQETVGNNIQFKVERVGADNVVLVYTPGGFGDLA